MTKNEEKSVDEEILNCLNLDNQKSFFLFAGAGSGKTKSLVSVLKRLPKMYSEYLYLTGKKVAIITYTKAARDEINRRLDSAPIFFVSTIHSFAWDLIHPYQKDIKDWLKDYLTEEINKLNKEQEKGRPGTKAYRDRPIKIKGYKKRLNNLEKNHKITYNPNGEHNHRISLNHAEVIKITSFLLVNKELLQRIMFLSYPVLLIDESQDTHKELLNSFRIVQNNYPHSFSLGLFGDMAQRVYFHGEPDLVECIPDTWEKPKNPVNHRCPKRIIKLINKIRKDLDDHQQIPGSNNEEGTVRLFILDTKNEFNKNEIETRIAHQMADICEDEGWIEKNGIKILTLEHHMAANRGDFKSFFSPLYNVDELKTGVLDVDSLLPGIVFFKNKILPLIEALQNGDKFLVCQIIKKESQFLEGLSYNSDTDYVALIKKADYAVNQLYKLWNNGNDPLLIDILNEIHRSKLFDIPDDINPIASRNDETAEIHSGIHDDSTDNDLIIEAWDKALSSPISQFSNYCQYISENSRFGTHQGVKGLQFPRVMVILDDGEAKGHQFQYEKLLTDKKNMSSLATQYLLYVTCSRTQKSLAIIIYTKNPKIVKENVISYGWFGEHEIIDNLISSK